MSFWAPFALTATTTALLALPVAPALHELCKRNDAGPLPTSRHNGKISNFAEVFQSRLEPLRPQLELCRARRELRQATIDKSQVLLVGFDDFDFRSDLMQGISAVMCSQTAVIPSGRIVEADLYIQGALGLGENAAVRAAAVFEDVILKQNSLVLRWLQAQGSIYMHARSTSYGRLSSNRAIYLARGCRFERMFAPQILAFDCEDKGKNSPSGLPGIDDCSSINQEICEETSGEHTMNAFDGSRRRMRVHGDFSLRGGESLSTNLIAGGELRLGPSAQLSGCAKSYGDTWLEENARVHGSIVCGGSLHVGPGAFVSGPIMAEGEIVLGPGSRIGRPKALTTLSCSSAKIAPGSRLHGTVWARRGGIVEV